MKKLILILLLACSWQAVAQVPTLYIVNGDRVPNYYYWDSNWADIYWNSPQYNLISHATFDIVTYKQVRARYFYTDTALKVIGMAAIFEIDTDGPGAGNTVGWTILLIGNRII